nr:MMPL family transporter [Treponema sp.]
FFNMLPDTTLGEAMGKADEKLSDNMERSIFILVSHEDFSKARETAEISYGALKDSDLFQSISLYAENSAITEIEEFTAPYRWQLLNEENINLLSTPEGAYEFTNSSLAQAYGSFTLTSLENLSQDPFLLDETNTQWYLQSIQEASTALSPKDGVLASNYEGKWYVMIRATLTEKGAAVASKTNGVSLIYKTCTPLEKDGIRFVYSGTPFHSHKSSTSAVKEIGIISGISISIVVIMLLLVFNSTIPIFASVLSVLISMGAAFCATMAIYGEIHVITMVLGTSLIGSCIDYSLHYFVNWKGHRQLTDTGKIRSHLLKGLFLSMMSTEICYIQLTFAPFTILKQMGLFSSIGILSSFLSVVCMYPLFPLPKAENRVIKALKFYKTSPFKKRPKATLIFTLTMMALFALVIITHHKDLKIHNDLFKLYTFEGRVKEDQDLCMAVTNYAPDGWFIVSGESEEKLLQNEEAICRELDKIQDKGYLALSRFIPSLEKQERSAKACENLLPFADEQFAMLGFDQTDSDSFKNQIKDALSKRLLPSQKLPSSVQSIADMLWLGQIDGKFYSIILPVVTKDEEAYTRIANENGNAYYENKWKDLGLGLDHLTRLIIMFFCIAYAVILIVLKRFYTWKQTAKIASLPVSCVLLIVSAFLLIGKSIEFFSLTGTILVFGLGLDYIIYMIENMKRSEENADSESQMSKLEPFAIALSFLTTAISFGALAFSSFVPVHTIGLSITLGLIAAFVCTIL